MSPPRKQTNVEEEEIMERGTGLSMSQIFGIVGMIGTIFCGGVAYATTAVKVETNKSTTEKLESAIEKRWIEQQAINRKFEALFVSHDERMDKDDLEDKLEEKDIKGMAKDLSEIKDLFKKYVEESKQKKP